MCAKMFSLSIFILALRATSSAATLTGLVSGGDPVPYYSTNNSFPGNGGEAFLYNVTHVAANSSAVQQMANLINDPNGPFSLDHTATAGTMDATGNINIDLHGIDQDVENANTMIAGLKATYTGSDADYWIQLVTTSAPQYGQDPTIDVKPPTSEPYYPNNTHNPNGSMTAEDGARRPKPLENKFPAPTNTVYWKGDLFLVRTTPALKDHKGTITILDGIEWGFTLAARQYKDDSGGDPQPNSLHAAPVPEPSSLAWLAPGLALALRRRKGKARQ